MIATKQKKHIFSRSFTAAHVAGIPIRLHASLLLFIPYATLVSAKEISAVAAAHRIPVDELSLPPLAWGVVLAFGLLAAVLLHELAHVAVARWVGVQVRSVTLMLLGGVSCMEEVPVRHEPAMALAGPAMNIALAAAGIGAYVVSPHPAEWQLALLLFGCNSGVLGLFNLLPAYPMDGGRALRGLLARWLGVDRATLLATRLGQGAGALVALLAVHLGNLLLLVAAGVVLVGATVERARMEPRALLGTDSWLAVRWRRLFATPA